MDGFPFLFAIPPACNSLQGNEFSFWRTRVASSQMRADAARLGSLPHRSLAASLGWKSDSNQVGGPVFCCSC